MAQIQFSLIKKAKIGRPEHSVAPHPPTSDNISFLPYPPPHLKVDVIYVSPLKAVFHSIKIIARADFLELKIPRGKI